jgi:hypothetical protein
MTRARSWILFCLLLLFVHGMAGCAGVARPADPAAAETDPACPEPTPRLEVVSTEVNLKGSVSGEVNFCADGE